MSRKICDGASYSHCFYSCCSGDARIKGKSPGQVGLGLWLSATALAVARAGALRAAKGVDAGRALVVSLSSATLLDTLVERARDLLATKDFLPAMLFGRGIAFVILCPFLGVVPRSA